jgi:hypothetical protein
VREHTIEERAGLARPASIVTATRLSAADREKTMSKRQNDGGISVTHAAPGHALLRLAAIVLLLGGMYGCESFRHTQPLDCQSAEQCRVEVSVVNGHIQVDWDEVAAHGHNVVWTVVNKQGQSYQFDHGAGIAFKTAAGQTAFRCTAEENDKRYRCTNNPQAPAARYEYGVKLVGSPAVPPLDPWVVNR